MSGLTKRVHERALNIALNRWDKLTTQCVDFQAASYFFVEYVQIEHSGCSTILYVTTRILFYGMSRLQLQENLFEKREL